MLATGLFALVSASALTGAGVYVNGVEQPARLELNDDQMLKEWGPSDRRGVALMAILALASAIAGLLAYFETSDVRFAVGAVISAASWPYTIFIMGPLDNQIITLTPKDVGAARALLWQWGLLEYGQTAISIVAVATFFLGAVNRRFEQPFSAVAENLRFFTRLPLGAKARVPDFTRIAWAAPLAGAIVGGLGALIFLAACKIGLPGIICSTLSVAAEIVLTGGLHEDGLADVADGFGGGGDRTAKLAIMRDSRIGTYGGIALCLNVLLRIEAIAALARPYPEIATGAFLLAGAASRAAALTPLAWTSPARADGVGASAGELDASVLVKVGATLAVIAVAVGLLLLGLTRSVVACFVGVLLAWLCVALARSQIGGQTGDVCGATAAIVQVGVLLTLLVGTPDAR